MKKFALLFWLVSLFISVYPQIILQSGSQLIISNAQVITTTGIVNNDGSIDMASSAVIENRGDLENNSSGLFTSTSTGTFKFNGSTTQEITGDHDAQFYGTIEIDNPNGVSITNSATGANQMINGTLVFTNGILTLNEFNLTLANDVTTPGPGKYVQTNSTGVLIRNVPADGSTNVTFPIGNSAYDPITLQNSGTASTDDYSVRVIDAEPAGSSTDHFVDRSWEVSENTAGGSELTITAQWNGAEELTGFDRDPSAVGLTTDAGSTYNWSSLDEASGSNPYTISGSTFTSVGIFAVGDSTARDNFKVTQQIDLTAGWNIESFNVMPDYISTDSIFKSMKESGILIKAIDEAGDFIQYIPGNGWLNTIGDMANTKGYYVKVSTNYQMTPRGFVPELPFDIPLSSGWNLMGYPMDVSQDAQNALQDIIDNNHFVKIIDEAGDFIQYIPGVGWLNSIGDFNPGEGYYIKVSGDDTLTLDTPSKKTNPDLFPIVKPELFKLSWSNNPYFPMNIIIRDISLEGTEPEEGDEVAVYDGEDCVGAGVVIMFNGKPTVQIIASMDDPTTGIVDGFVSGNPISFKFMSTKLGDIISLHPDYTWGKDRFEALETCVCEVTNSFADINDRTSNDFYFKCYPNPVKETLNLSYKLVTAGEVRIELLDIFGNRVSFTNKGITSTDPQQISIDMTQLSKGLYLVRFSFRTDKKVDYVIVKVVKE